MMRTSIRKQLFSLFMPILLVLLGTSSLLSYSFVSQFSSDLFDRNLLNSADSISGRVRLRAGKIVADLPPAAQAILKNDNSEKFFYRVLDSIGRKVSGDDGLPVPNPDLDLDSAKISTTTIAGQRVRLTETKTPVDGSEGEYAIVQFAQTMNGRKEFQDKILLSVFLPQALLVIVGLIAAWYGVSRILTPLKSLQTQLAKRSPTDLSPLSDAHTPSEVYPLVTAINQLLEQSKEAIITHQRFIANAAHQLRTPLAGLKTYSSIGIQMVDADELRHIVRELDSGIDRSTRMVSQLLALARSEIGERPMSRANTPVNLNDLVQAVLSENAHESMRRNLELNFEPLEQPAVLQGDPTGLRHLVSNLIENAMLYSPEEGKISITLNLHESKLIFTVTDNGPGIPEPERQRVFERFYRINGTSGQGSGLGLAIVREVALAHEASTEIETPQSGQGTTVRVVFPAPA